MAGRSRCSLTETEGRARCRTVFESPLLYPLNAKVVASPTLWRFVENVSYRSDRVKTKQGGYLQMPFHRNVVAHCLLFFFLFLFFPVVVFRWLPPLSGGTFRKIGAEALKKYMNTFYLLLSLLLLFFYLPANIFARRSCSHPTVRFLSARQIHHNCRPQPLILVATTSLSSPPVTNTGNDM